MFTKTYYKALLAGLKENYPNNGEFLRILVEIA